ncbi:unnamed protein product [Allacma fusca]|uniref:Uncharacterized protein n=1 Tax=Allacma fusca TaxID=39272 RepID=A0A8J2JKX2_9HEXA|nr:unnamed protein product [Allacma fusca]
MGIARDELKETLHNLPSSLVTFYPFYIGDVLWAVPKHLMSFHETIYLTYSTILTGIYHVRGIQPSLVVHLNVVCVGGTPLSCLQHSLTHPEPKNLNEKLTDRGERLPP